MAAQSKLRENAAQFSAHYLRNQPRYQRLLMSSFSLYVILATYKGLTPKKKAKKAGVKEGAAVTSVVDEKGSNGMEKGKGGRKKKRAPRVEVSLHFYLYSLYGAGPIWGESELGSSSVLAPLSPRAASVVTFQGVLFAE